MIDPAVELAAWQAAFPDYVDWDFRANGGMVIVMAKHESREWGRHNIAFACMAGEYDREAAFNEERSVRAIAEGFVAERT